MLNPKEFFGNRDPINNGLSSLTFLSSSGALSGISIPVIKTVGEGVRITKEKFIPLWNSVKRKVSEIPNQVIELGSFGRVNFDASLAIRDVDMLVTRISEASESDSRSAKPQAVRATDALVLISGMLAWAMSMIWIGYTTGNQMMVDVGFYLIALAWVLYTLFGP